MEEHDLEELFSNHRVQAFVDNAEMGRDGVKLMFRWMRKRYPGEDIPYRFLQNIERLGTEQQGSPLRQQINYAFNWSNSVNISPNRWGDINNGWKELCRRVDRSPEYSIDHVDQDKVDNVDEFIIETFGGMAGLQTARRIDPKEEYKRSTKHDETFLDFTGGAGMHSIQSKWIEYICSGVVIDKINALINKMPDGTEGD